MRRIGVLVGDETALVSALAESLRGGTIDGVIGGGIDGVIGGGIDCGLVKIGGTSERHVSRYDVIVDRFSWAVPHYRAYVRSAALAGCHVINDPALDYDGFSALSLAARKGFAVARTSLLPQKNYDQIDPQRCLHNLQYPLDWGAIGAYVRFPAHLRSLDGRSVDVANADDLLHAFDQSSGVVVLQEHIKAPQVRVLCVGATAIPLGDCPSAVATLATDLNAALGLDIGQVDVALSDPPTVLWCYQRHTTLEPTQIGEHAFAAAVEALTKLCADLAYRGRR